MGMGRLGSHGNGSKICHGMGMEIKCMGMGVKTWEFLHSNMDSNAGGATAWD